MKNKKMLFLEGADGEVLENKGLEKNEPKFNGEWQFERQNHKD